MVQAVNLNQMIQEYYDLLPGGRGVSDLAFAPSTQYSTGVETGIATQQRQHAENLQNSLMRRSALKDMINLAQSTSGFGADGGLGAGASSAGGTAGVAYAGPEANRFEKRLMDLLDDPSKIQQTAAYKFRQQQGEEALQRQLGARGLLRSGNRLQELTKYGQDMASQEYDAQMGRISGLYGGENQYQLGVSNSKNQFALGQGELALKQLLGQQDYQLKSQQMQNRVGMGGGGGGRSSASGFSNGGIVDWMAPVAPSGPDLYEQRANRQASLDAANGLTQNADRAWGRNLRASYGLG